ncbi:hypothetical protein [Imtechella halotolerans]|uniref:DUF4890 domain-containing protein n=1 Tax=Imtechella halotolerans K1 TaxID=946077 RepID=I0WIG3_9FLAO|nr:hypothetical protein [Imtechella halotolerans]EID76179.1 hypothetical protein W5A_04514 [Imtechella halotolerans K1]WMQ63365.1 hypothetical protein PT603_13655 [Imtechella halotolerans]
MKKWLTLAILALFTITTFAQEKEKMVDKKSDKKEMRKTNRSQRATAMRDMTPEQQADLQTKRMALDLDLSESQQAELLKLNTELAKERAKKREEMMQRRQNSNGERPSSDEMYKMRDQQLAQRQKIKEKMKLILSAEQFAKWEANQEKEREKQRQNFQKRDW